MSKKSKKPKRDPHDDVRRFLALKQEAGNIAVEMKEIRERVLGHVMERGTEDSKGNFWARLAETVLKLELRTKRKLNEDVATRILKAKKIYNRAVKTIKILDLDLIQELVMDEKLKPSDLQAMIDEREEWAIKPNPKERPKEPGFENLDPEDRDV